MAKKPAKCKCGKNEIVFQNLIFEDINGKWECDKCNDVPEKKVEAPKSSPKEEEVKEVVVKKAAKKKASKRKAK